MPPPGILLHPLSASSLLRPSTSAQYDFYPSTTRKRRPHCVSFRCKAASSSSSSFSVTDFDLYDLLGIDNSSDQSQIKAAYRSLQKRCHPDIAGPSGHEMAIILNDVYSILSDPNLRAAYDEEQAKMEEFRGYSGKPLYSRWFGSESEERAAFVDEVKCVGCLKCALLAEKTFAIESVYGRARVVAQWADPEDKILDAIEACPVDCISMVQRSNLAALEFLMSKQPRGNARTNVKGMVDVKKFQTKLQEAKNRESIQDPREVAFHTIRSFSNWFYWQSPKGGEHGMSLIHITDKTSPFNTQKLRDAAAAAKQGFWAPSATPRTYNDTHNDDSDYWTPLTVVPDVPVFDTASTNTSTGKPGSTANTQNLREFRDYAKNNMMRDRKDAGLAGSFPLGMATLAAVVVRLQQGEALSSGTGEHVAGPLALEIVNSSWLQAILAGVTWYIIGIFTVELIRVFTNKQKS